MLATDTRFTRQDATRQQGVASFQHGKFSPAGHFIRESCMDDPHIHHRQTAVRILAGALAHLAQHMESGCPRSAYLAAMLLEQIALDPSTDSHLRQHARQLIEILERCPNQSATTDRAPGQPPRHPGLLIRKCA